MASTEAVTLNRGDILVVDTDAFDGGGGLIAVNPATGAQSVVASSFITGVAPCGILVEASGNVLVSDQDVGSIIRVNPVTGNQAILTSDTNFHPCGMALENSGSILAADRSGKIIRVNPVTGARSVVSSGGFLLDTHDVAIESNGNLVAVDMGFGGQLGRVIRIDPTTGSQSVLSSGGSFLRPWWITVASNGDIFVTDNIKPPESQIGTIFRIDPVSGAQTIVSAGDNLIRSNGIAIDANGDLIVAQMTAGSGLPAVFRVNPVTGVQSLVSSNGYFFNPYGIKIFGRPLKTGDILVADADAFEGGAVFGVDSSTGVQTVISYGGSFHQPCGIAFEANGNLLVGDRGGSGVTGKVIRVNPQTGQQTVLSVGGGPCGIAVEEGGTFVVANMPQNSIIRFDPITASQTVLSSGSALVEPRDVALDASGNILVDAFGPPPGPGSIVRVDSVNGGQTVISTGGIFVHPWFLAIAGNGDIFVTDENTKQILRVDPTTGSQTFITSLDRPSGIVVDSSGDLIVAQEGVGSWVPGIFRINPATGAQTIVSSYGYFFNPDGVTIFRSRNNTPVGSNVSVLPGVDISLVFTNIASSGVTSATLSGSGPTPPSGFSFGDPATYYDLTTTATFTGTITVCFTYDPNRYVDPSALQLRHYESGNWINVTTSNNTTTHVICGEVTSFSPFAIAEQVTFVGIDIKPGSYPNTINLGSGGTVPVAILSTATFDARTVDPTTVSLASAPVKLTGKGNPMASQEDVNNDGRLDLVVHVTTSAFQLTVSDTIAVLKGKTNGGVSIKGSDTIRVVP